MGRMQRLVAGSARIGQRIAAAVNPSGSVFNDLRPPMPNEAIAGLSGLARGLVTGVNGGMCNVTTSEAALNGVMAFEVFCWYCIGEAIGRGSWIGYNVKRVHLLFILSKQKKYLFSLLDIT